MALHWSLKTLMKWICHASFPPFLQAAPFMQENSSLFFPVFVCLWGLETDVAAGNKPLRPKSALSVLSRVSQLLIAKVPLLLSSLLWHCTPFTQLWHSDFFCVNAGIWNGGTRKPKWRKKLHLLTCSERSPCVKYMASPAVFCARFSAFMKVTKLHVPDILISKMTPGAALQVLHSVVSEEGPSREDGGGSSVDGNWTLGCTTTRLSQ